MAALIRLVAGDRRDAGALDEAEGSQTSRWKGGEARRTETRLPGFEQQALGSGFWN